MYQIAWCSLFLIQFPSLVISFADETKTSLGRRIRTRWFILADTIFNDGRSCSRVCDGRIKTCYYEFSIEKYDSMSGLCGDCKIGKLSDCFLDGCIPANGVPRTIMTINRELPGPSINCCKDDRIIVDVRNHMTGEELTIHWHGLHQKETPWFDGVPMVTQCPIASGNTFRYVFNARVTRTHYYHAHSGLHRTNGLIGKLNILDPNDSNADYYDYDLSEHSLVLSDWSNELAEEGELYYRPILLSPNLGKCTHFIIAQTLIYFLVENCIVH